MYELGAHGTRFAGHDEPCVSGCDSIGGGIADDIHFRVVTANFHTGTRLYFHRISQALIPAAELTARSRASVVSIHEYDVPFGIEEEGTKFSSGTIGRFGEANALFDANFNVFSRNHFNAGYQADVKLGGQMIRNTTWKGKGRNISV